MSSSSARLWEQVRALELELEQLQSQHAFQRATLQALRQRAASSLPASPPAWAAHLGHELRAPLTAMLGYVDVLREQMQHDAAPADWCATLATIRRSGHTLLERIDALLQLAPPKATVPPDAAPTAGTMLSGRILLADDVPDTRQLLALLLTKAGAQVTTVNDGRAACTAVWEAVPSGAAYDLILMDMEMPVLSGYEACRQLREAGYRGPIVAVTAHQGPAERARCLAAGCDDCLVKPFPSSALVETARRYLPHA